MPFRAAARQSAVEHDPTRNDPHSRHALTFPWSDANWTEVAEFCRGAGLLSRPCLAPLEFSALSETFRPPIYSLLGEAQPPDALVVHKGLIGRYDLDMLRAFRRDGAYVFGNGVFLILTRTPTPSYKGAPEHVTVLDRYLETGRDENARAQAEHTDYFERWHEGEPVRGGGARIAVVSASRMGNFGDDLLTFATRKVLLRAAEGANVRIFAPPVEQEAVSDIDILALGAGGLLYDGSRENVLNYMHPLALAARRGIKTICIGQGVQGISTALGKDVFRQALSRSAGVTTRDRESARILTDDVGVTSPVHTLQDLAFALGDEMDTAAESAPQARCGAKPRVLVSLSDPSRLGASRAPRTASLLARFGEVNRWFAREYASDFDLTFFVQSRDDKEFYKRLQPETGIGIMDPNDAPLASGLRHYAAADLVVTSRLHGLILACLARKPVIAVSTRGTKVHRLIDESAPSLLGNLILLGDYDADALRARLEAFVQGRLPAITEGELARAKRAALENISLVKALLS
jgi:polysaccharide pyruvyl transferase WcaK-like protein